MTRKQRAQVVELLRCAADVFRVHGRTDAAIVINQADRDIASLCFDAEWDAGRGFDFWTAQTDAHCDLLLEAALRLEIEGEEGR